MIKIDGSQGEGGGQIVRSSLALSMVTGKGFEISHVRGKRKKPGLLKQHLTGLLAAKQVCGAEVSGAELHSPNISFHPGPVQTRGFRFSIGSAGSATLVAQTVLPALITATGKSSIEIEGGTHNMAAPPFDFLTDVYFPIVTKLGPKFETDIESYGFYPAGGGRIKIHIQPTAKLQSLILLEREGTLEPSITALVSKLPEHIGEREIKRIKNKSGWRNPKCRVETIENSPGPGNCVMIRLAYSNVSELCTGFGRRGIKAEQVAVEAWRQAKQYLDHDAPVGQYLADQLILPLAISASQGNRNKFRTGPLSLHTETHIQIIQLFLEVSIKVTEIDTDKFEIELGPR